MSRVTAKAYKDSLLSITNEFEGLFSDLRPLGDAFARVVASSDNVTRSDLQPLHGQIFSVLDDHRDFVAGAGIVVAPDLLADSPLWLEWWWTRPSGTPEAVRVNLDPAAPDFFDYPRAEWFESPMSQSTRYVAGPFVDYACTNEYAITAALPIVVQGQVVGVAAADVLVASLERRIMPRLCALGEPVLLINRGGRIIASTSAEFAPGTRVGAIDGARSRADVTVPGIDWRLVPASIAA
jgi:hypothetical protein